jgi:hypothetical protein
MLRARLDHEERGQQHDGRAEQAERLERRPAGLVAVDDRVDRGEQRGGHRDRAGDVDTVALRELLLARQQAQPEEVDRNADRDVHEEDPVPVQRVGEDAAEQHADGAAAG